MTYAKRPLVLTVFIGLVILSVYFGWIPLAVVE